MKEKTVMAKTLIAYFSRADENYFGGAMRYVKVGNTEIVVGVRMTTLPGQYISQSDQTILTK